MVKQEQIPFEPSITFAKVCGNVTEVTEMRNIPHPTMVNISKDYMMNLGTGEVVEKNHTENRAEGKQSIRRTLAKIRDLVNANCTTPDNLLWATLTYAENTTDPKRLATDFDVFWKRFRRYCKSKGYPIPEYIAVAEPQGRGAWHLHLILIWDGSPPYIPNNAEFFPLWGQGFTKLKRVYNCDNIGAYFSAYLADIDITDEPLLQNMQVDNVHVIEKVSNGKRKKILKGGRLHLYPTGMNIVRHSRGCKQPVIESGVEAKEKASGGTETYSQTYAVYDDDGVLVNVIRKTYYNAVRGKSATVFGNSDIEEF